MNPPVVTLGRSTTGLPPRWDLSEGHVLVAGTTGAGKSSWINSAVAGCAVYPDVQPVGVDLKRVELSPWAGRLAALARTPPEVAALADHLERLLDYRAAMADAHGLKAWPSTPRHPHVPVIIDELAEAAEVDAFAATLLRIGRIGRALGVEMFAATQQASAKVLGGTDLRGLFNRRALLFDPEPESRTMLLGRNAEKQYSNLLAWLSMAAPGLAIWRDPYAWPVPWLARAWHWSDDDVYQQVRITARLARPLAMVIDAMVTAA